jgi:hypothetical protein
MVRPFLKSYFAWYNRARSASSVSAKRTANKARPDSKIWYVMVVYPLVINLKPFSESGME